MLGTAIGMLAAYAGCNQDRAFTGALIPKDDQPSLKQVNAASLDVEPAFEIVTVGRGVYSSSSAIEQAADLFIALHPTDIRIDYFEAGDKGADVARAQPDELYVAVAVEKPGAVEDFDDAMFLGEFTLKVDQGTATRSLPPSIHVEEDARAMFEGDFELWFLAESSFTADVTIERVRVLGEGGPLSGGCGRDPVWVCDGDVDGDGQVNPVDSGLVQAAFGSQSGPDLCQYDVDCDGQINPADSGIVQSLFGTCNAPRAACP